MNTDAPRKIVVIVAPVGGDIPPPSINPLTPEDIANDVIACTEAGASVVHLHVRDIEGNLTDDLTVFSRTIDLIRNTSDIIVNGSTGGLSTLSLEERCVALKDSRIEVASLNMGSINFGEDAYINRMPDIRYWARRMAEARVMPELEIFDSGMLPAYRNLLEEKVLQPPYTLNFCLGGRWILAAVPESIFFLKSLLPGSQIPWGVVHVEMKDLALLATAIGMGASFVRVGFEDSPYFAPGKAATTNVILVEKIAALIRQMGHVTATPAEARELFGIPTKTG